MPRKFLRKFMPRGRHGGPHAHHGGRWGKLIHDPSLWHLNRHSVARGMALGVFWSFTPLPFGQTVFATLMAIRMRANVALAAAFTWVCNPLTMPATIYLAYSLGRMILRQRPMPDFQANWRWVKANLLVWGNLMRFGLPYALGSMILACGVGAITYVVAQEYWKWRVVRRWKARGRVGRVGVVEEVGV